MLGRQYELWIKKSCFSGKETYSGILTLLKLRNLFCKKRRAESRDDVVDAYGSTAFQMSKNVEQQAIALPSGIFYCPF
jgi:hypothetical protein